MALTRQNNLTQSIFYNQLSNISCKLLNTVSSKSKNQNNYMAMPFTILNTQMAEAGNVCSR